MSNISQLISLPIFSVNEKKCIGHIENILFDNRSIKYYVVYDENTDLKYLLPPQNIYGQTLSAITIKNMSAITLMQNEDMALEGLHNPINSLVLNTKGEVFGTVRDIIVEGKTITKIVCDEQKSPRDILYFSQGITMLKNHTHEHVSTFAIKPNTKDEDVRKVTIQNIAPLREIVGNSMLIGRKATQDITGQNGEIIIKANSTITAKTLSKIKYNGKLRELTLHSK